MKRQAFILIANGEPVYQSLSLSQVKSMAMRHMKLHTQIVWPGGHGVAVVKPPVYKIVPRDLGPLEVVP